MPKLELVKEPIKLVEDVEMERRQKDRLDALYRVSKSDVSKASIEELRVIVKDLLKVITGE